MYTQITALATGSQKQCHPYIHERLLNTEIPYWITDMTGFIPHRCMGTVSYEKTVYKKNKIPEHKQGRPGEPVNTESQWDIYKMFVHKQEPFAS
jgi:hypothetical protein